MSKIKENPYTLYYDEIEKSLRFPFDSRITELSEDIMRFPDLEKIYLDYTNIQTIPNFITKLKHLKEIHISRCKNIKTIPNIPGYSISDDQLDKLNISPENIISLHIGVSNSKWKLDQFVNLKKITIPEIKRETLETIQKLTYLESIRCFGYIDTNGLRTFPLDRIKTLMLTYEQFAEINSNKLHSQIKNITSLGINFFDEKQYTIDLDLSFFNKLKSLTIDGESSMMVWKSIDLGQIESFALFESDSYNPNLLFAALPQCLNSLICFNSKLGYLSEYKMPSGMVNISMFNCELKILPKNLLELRKLIQLNLSNNQITSIPSGIVGLPNLESINLTNNTTLISPPYEIIKEGNQLDALRRYFALGRKEGYKNLYEAKMLVIGEGEVGKTTLVNKIINPNYKLVKGSTDGIAIFKYSFKSKNGESYHVNIWDFGGQEIYHSTHQFFLTTDSFYVLVDDGRKHKTDFFYWLRIVKLLSDNSPLMLIQNRRDNKGTDINPEPLSAEYSNLISPIYYSNLEKNENLESITSTIQDQLLGLKHIGIPLPASFPRIREKLEKRGENYINEDELRTICRSEGLSEENDFELLSDVFRQIGVFLHYREDSSLKNLVILNHEWATDAVYRVLDNPLVKDEKKGRFTEFDAKEIWSDTKYLGKYKELLTLMKKFNVAYEIRDSCNYVVPHLLPYIVPDYPWTASHNIILKYRYKFMPKGLVNRFTVELYDYIYKDKVWKEGVIICRDNDTWAEVIERYHSQEIQIRVRGKFKKEFLTIITEKFKEIHKPYQIKPEMLIPCNCSVCENSETPHFYEYSKLREFLSNKRMEERCVNKPYEIVKIQPLIDDVLFEDSFYDIRGHYVDYTELKISGNKDLIKDLIQKPNSLGKLNISVEPVKSDPDFKQPALLAIVILIVAVSSVILIARLNLPYYLIPVFMIVFVFIYILVTFVALLVSGHIQEKSFISIVKIVLSKTPGLNFLANFLKTK